MFISAFSFVHNAIDGGYPIFDSIFLIRKYVNEIVIVDMESTDGTRELLEKMNVRIIDGKWGNKAGETLKDAHSMHSECYHNTIIHFEADEVYDVPAIRKIKKMISFGEKNILISRLQLEQNFQRVRWYPELVHRVFQNDGTVKKVGHSTDLHLIKKEPISICDTGYLWDITNCFRDNWLKRLKQQRELWNEVESPTDLIVPKHINDSNRITKSELEKFFSESHWYSEKTPFNLPLVLQKWIGKTKYEPEKYYG